MSVECDECGESYKSERGLKVHKGRSHNPKHQRKEFLQREYVENEKSTIQIGEMVDKQADTIKYWLKKHGIERRHRGHRQLWSENKPEMEELYKKYCVEKQSTNKLAEEYEVSAATVANWLRSYNIEVRSRAESLELHIPSEEKLRHLHFEQGLKQWQIALKYDDLRSNVSHWFRKYDIETRTYSGEEAPRWAGGHEEYYGACWPEQRKKRLEYDNNECVVCGMGHEKHGEKYGQELHVHHIHKLRYFRLDNGQVDYESANSIENLITLCAKHHKKWEGIPLRPQQ